MTAQGDNDQDGRPITVADIVVAVLWSALGLALVGGAVATMMVVLPHAPPQAPPLLLMLLCFLPYVGLGFLVERAIGWLATRPRR